ncbi:hypothetical protein [Burkholderia multivorans]|uniref:hypothetical protein n=1 Tax=Burkholderia multivorans TaxID=87883 RepID=UPI001FC8B6F7|nr:hypothetical protein [Burkholderia multivorans]
MNREDGLLRRAQIMHDDFGERREHLAEPFGDALHLFDQRGLLRFQRRRRCGGPAARALRLRSGGRSRFRLHRRTPHACDEIAVRAPA